MGLSLLYISIEYYMQKGGWWVQIACKIAYILNGRPLGIHQDYQNKSIFVIYIGEIKVMGRQLFYRIVG